MEEIKVMKERELDIFVLIDRKWLEKGRIKQKQL
jgi:hypothetical protein